MPGGPGDSLFWSGWWSMLCAHHTLSGTEHTCSNIPPITLHQPWFTCHLAPEDLWLEEGIQIARRFRGSREPTQSGRIPFQLWSSGKHCLLPVPDRGWQQLLRPEEEESLPNVHWQQTQEFLFFSTPVLWRLMTWLVHTHKKNKGFDCHLGSYGGQHSSLVTSGLPGIKGNHTETAFTHWSEELFPDVWSVLWSHIMFKSWWNGAVRQRTVCVCRTEHFCKSTWRLTPTRNPNGPSLRPCGKHPSEKEHGEDDFLAPEWPLPGAKLPL